MDYRKVFVCLLCGAFAAAAWAKPHGMAPVAARHAAASQQAAAMKMQRTQQVNAMKMQHAATSAAIKQQKAIHHQDVRALQYQQHVARGPGFHHGPVFRAGPGPSDLHRWRRGHAPHPHYRSGWYENVWYDAYGYPYDYGTTVVTPAPTVVAPAPVVVAPAPTVVAPAPAVVTPAVVTPTVVTPAPAVVTPAPTVVAPAAPAVVY